jgi:hypothetical protein
VLGQRLASHLARPSQGRSAVTTVKRILVGVSREKKTGAGGDGVALGAFSIVCGCKATRGDEIVDCVYRFSKLLDKTPYQS